MNFFFTVNNFHFQKVFQAVLSIKSDINTFIGMLSMTFPGFFFLFKMVASSERVFEAERKKIFNLIDKNNLRDDWVNGLGLQTTMKQLTDSYSQAKWLMLQINDQTIEFKIFNMQGLNHRFLYEILTFSCSYFIILIQFELSSD